MVAKARLVEIRWNSNQTQANPVPDGQVVEVQFNPESLKVTYSNENRGGGQPGGGGGQFVGSGTSKMTIELLFDTTDTGRDVRRLTKQVAYFIEPKDARRQQGSRRNTSRNRVPPGISFEWGTFIFSGVADTMEETLDYFSEEGVPLRATVSLNLTRQQLKFDIKEDTGLGEGHEAAQTPEIEPIEIARENDSMQDMAGRDNRSGDWKSIAAANNIDNPRRLRPGSPINLNTGTASATASFRGGAFASASAGAAFSAGAGAGAGIAGSAQAGFSAGLGAGTGFGASAGLSAGAAAGAAAGGSLSAGGTASAGLGARASAGAAFGGGASIQGAASFGLSGSTGASASVSGGGFAGASLRSSAGAGASASASARARSNVSGKLVLPSLLLDI